MGSFETHADFLSSTKNIMGNLRQPNPSPGPFPKVSVYTTQNIKEGEFTRREQASPIAMGEI